MLLEKHLEHSGRIAYEDLDWSEAKRAGLSDDEIFILTYFADIESQTVVYMRHILNTKGALDPEVMSFLTIWNYEEFYHGHALSKLLEACGYPLETNRISKVQQNAAVSETLKAIGAKTFSFFWPEAFIALYLSWGALNELTTLRGYEAIESQTKNPVLKTLCQRIAKQERRHFAWYYNSAEQRLVDSPSVQKMVRSTLNVAWSPVGAGVKPLSVVRRLFDLVFPGGRGAQLAEEIDTKISNLPGLQGLRLMQSFAEKGADYARKNFPLADRSGLHRPNHRDSGNHAPTVLGGMVDW